jgi:hypothetical protein
VRVDAESGRIETLESWPSTPVSRRVISEYRGRVFNTMRASVRPDAGGAVRYEIEMAIPVVPLSEVHVLAGNWARTPVGHSRGEWRRHGSLQMGLSEPVLAGQIEVFTLKGPEFFPSAVVLLDHLTMKTRVLLKSAAYGDRYPDGPPIRELLEVSRKKDIERIAELKRARNELVARYRAQGLTEIEALLRSNRDLEDGDYLPKSPRVVARKLEQADISAMSTLPLFDIADAEMASGIFPDIEKALATPGDEVDKSMGKYIVHRDHGNSERLNALLAGGAREFLVRFRNETYRIELRFGR